MPEISGFLGIIIAMYYDDHEPAHFHVRYERYDAKIAIIDLRLISGVLPRRVLSLVLEWAFEYRPKLLENWGLCRARKPMKKIPPGLTPWHIKNAQYLEDYKLLLSFADGSRKIVDLKPHIRGEVFEALKKISYFKLVKVNPELDTIHWDNGADFAPEFLYEIGVAAKQKAST